MWKDAKNKLSTEELIEISKVVRRKRITNWEKMKTKQEKNIERMVYKDRKCEEHKICTKIEENKKKKKEENTITNRVTGEMDEIEAQDSANHMLFSL